MFTVQPEALPLKQRMQNRRLIVVDLENVIGAGDFDADAVRWAREEIVVAVNPQPGDHIVVSTSHHGLLPAGCGWPGLRYVMRSGPDGADLALLEVLDEDVESRFEQVVVVSGDGIFADKVSELGRCGVSVVVLAHPDGLAARLRLAARGVLHLPSRWPLGVLGGAA